MILLPLTEKASVKRNKLSSYNSPDEDESAADKLLYTFVSETVACNEKLLKRPEAFSLVSGADVSAHGKTSFKFSRIGVMFEFIFIPTKLKFLSTLLSTQPLYIVGEICGTKTLTRPRLSGSLFCKTIPKYILLYSFTICNII